MFSYESQQHVLLSSIEISCLNLNASGHFGVESAGRTQTALIHESSNGHHEGIAAQTSCHLVKVAGVMRTHHGQKRHNPSYSCIECKIARVTLCLRPFACVSFGIMSGIRFRIIATLLRYLKGMSMSALPACALHLLERRAQIHLTKKGDSNLAPIPREPSGAKIAFIATKGILHLQKITTFVANL